MIFEVYAKLGIILRIATKKGAVEIHAPFSAQKKDRGS
jgi:hypothetical protein